MLNMNTVSVEQTAKSLRIGTDDLHELLTEFCVPETDGMITLRDAQDMIELLEDSEILSEKRAMNYLRFSAGSSTIVFDTCALVHGMFPALFRRLSPILAALDRKMLVPRSVVNELKNLFLRRAELREPVRTALALLDEGIRVGTVDICGEEGSFGDQQVLAILSALRTSGSVLLVTQDSALSEDALRLNCLGSVQGSGVFVNRVSQFGYLSRYTSQQNAAQGRVGQQTALS